MNYSRPRPILRLIGKKRGRAERSYAFPHPGGYPQALGPHRLERAIARIGRVQLGPQMSSLTRSEALTQARHDFLLYVDRVAQEGRLPPAYVSDLGRYWDRRLAALAQIGAEVPVADAVVASLWILSREIRHNEMDPDAALRWIDVFPDRVADLFPPSLGCLGRFFLIDQAECHVRTVRALVRTLTATTMRTGVAISAKCAADRWVSWKRGHDSEASLHAHPEWVPVADRVVQPDAPIVLHG
jgi:hypothetical protein